MKVLIATGIEKLDNELSKTLPENEIEVAGSCFHRSVLEKVLKETGADTVIISPVLNGDDDLVALIRSVREKGIRVIVLPGSPSSPQTVELVKSLVPYGVYDFVYDFVKPGDIVYKLRNPGNLGEVTKLFADEAFDVQDFDYGKKDCSSKGKEKEIKKTKDDEKQNFTKNKIEIRLRNNGKPLTILAVNDKQFEDWFCKTFSGLLTITAITKSAEELERALTKNTPDICIIMRSNHTGGIPEADKVAVQSAKYVPAVLFIAGELDDTGEKMVEHVRAAGIRHILSCPPGGYISGEELVFQLQSIVRTIQETESSHSGESDPVQRDGRQKTIEGLELIKKKAIKLGNILRPASLSGSNRPGKKKIIPAKRVNLKEGLALEDTPEDNEKTEGNTKNPTAIVPGGLFAVVSPWRPGLAGRMAAQAVKMFAEVEGVEVAYIGASGQSTGAHWLDVPADELIMSDWRVPGSQAPIKKGNLQIYAVDPIKNLNGNNDELWNLVKSVRKNVTYTVMDFAGDIDAAQKAAFQGWSVVLVIIPGGDPVETKTSLHWLKSMQEGKQNIIPGIDLRGTLPAVPDGLEPKVTIRNNPADALSMALRKNENGEFVWNR